MPKRADELSTDEEMSDDDEIYSPETQEQGDDESEGTPPAQDEQIDEDGNSVYKFGDSEPEAESTSSSSSSSSELAVPINAAEVPQQCDEDEEEEQDQKEDICFTSEFFDPKTDDLSKFGFEPKGVSFYTK